MVSRRLVPFIPFLVACLLALPIGCNRERPPVSRVLIDTFAVHDLNAQLLESLELHPQPLNGGRVHGRALGPLTLEGSTAVWVDPEMGIHLIDLSSPATRRPVDPKPIARLFPRQRPAECVLLQGAAVIRSESGPFALELMIRDGEEAPDDLPEAERWDWVAAVQRGHYDAIWPAGPQQVLAWDRGGAALDLWSIDQSRRSLEPVWHWPLPEATDAIAVDGAYLALAVHGAKFDARGRSREGNGILLYGLDADPKSPTLYHRWMAPGKSPITGLLWYGRGLIAAQEKTVHVLQRDQRSLLQSLGQLATPEQLIPVAASGRYVWLDGDAGVRVMDIKEPQTPALLPGSQEPLVKGTPFVVHRQLLWYLQTDPTIPQEPGEPLTVEYRHVPLSMPAVALRAVSLTSRGQPAPEDADLAKSYPRSLAAHEGVVLVGEGTAGIGLYKLSTPDLASYVRHIRLSGEVQQIEVEGHWAYVTTATSGFQVLDLRNPEEPLVVPARKGDLYEQGDGFLAIDPPRFLAAGKSLAMGRITQPGVLTIDQRLPLPEPAKGLATAAHKVFVACGKGGLFILNITAGHAPVIMNHLRTGHAWGPIAVQGDILYAIRNKSELAVLNIAQSSTPEVIQIEETGGTATLLSIDRGHLLVGTRAAAGFGAMRFYKIEPDGRLSWKGAHLLPGTPTAYLPSPAGSIEQHDLVSYASTGGNKGVDVLPAIDAPAMAVVGPLDLPPAPGPWLVQGDHFWTSSSTEVKVHDASQAGFPEIAATEFADPATKISLAGLRLMKTRYGALGVIGQRWVHMRLSPQGTIATDPWPLGATEQVLATGGDHVLVWDRQTLRYTVYQLQPDGPPVPGDTWTGVYPEGGGPWEVTSGFVDANQNRYAVAEQFGGATLFAGSAIEQRIGNARVTAVGIAPDGSWAAASADSEQATLLFDSASGRSRPHALPGIAREILMPSPGLALVLWDGGLTLVDEVGGVRETFAGSVESAQLGSGWNGVSAGEVIVRFTGQEEWWVLRVTVS